MRDIREVAGADAAGAERAAECHQHRQILFQDGLEVKVNRITGAKTLEALPRRRPEIPQKYRGAVPGLSVFFYDSRIGFEWFTDECIDASDCIDAQCRAGWNDDGYGFGDLKIGVMPDGRHRAKWNCGVINE